MRTDISPPYFALLIISAAALAYEVLLIRLFSIIQWHHFAYMVISLALLGYGASGTYLTLMRRRLIRRFSANFVANAALFSITSIGCFLLAQRLPFNTLEMFLDKRQWLFLLLSYLLLFTPFFFAANCVCLAFARFGGCIPRIYAFDLIGAGLGALGVIAGLYLLPPQGVLQGISALGMLAAALATLEGQVRHRWQASVPYVCMALVAGLLPAQWLELRPSQYKALSQTLQVKGARVLGQRSSPLGLLTVVENSQVPLRLAPGLSLNNLSEPPPQIAIFSDGDAPTAITRYQGADTALAYLDFQTSALPYHLQAVGQVLILGAGGGSSALQALYHGVDRIDAVEVNPQLAAFLHSDYADFAGWQWLKQKTRIHIGEARGFISASQKLYPLIQISLLDSAGAASGGVQGLSESYLYTREGVAAYLAHLEPDGLLAVTRWLKLPPRDGLKLFATAVAALRLSGVTDPADQLLLIRGWSTSTLVVKNGRFTKQEIARLRSFCEQRSFDVAHYPGMGAEQANRYNILPEPYFFLGAKALLGTQAERFVDHYKFDIRPTSDDRPFFFDFFKWSTLPEILSLFRRGGFSLLELGYQVLLLTLLQAIVASLLLVLLPLAFVGRSGDKTQPGERWSLLLYFIAIGFAFLFIEIAFIQKFMLFLAAPVYAVAVVLCGFLVFSGTGSLYASRLEESRHGSYIFPVVLTLAAITLLYLWLLPPLFAHAAHLPAVAKIILSLLLIAPLGFCMGMPFPLGLSRVDRAAPSLVPWAWAVNGCSSLTSAILASVLAVHVGFNLVTLTAVALYVAAAWVFPRLPGERHGSISG
jgi:hypothetical protein